MISGLFGLLFMLLALLAFVFWIWMLIDCIIKEFISMLTLPCSWSKFGA